MGLMDIPGTTPRPHAALSRVPDAPTVAQWRDALVSAIVMRPEHLRATPRLARGRVLAADVVAPEDLPPVPVSAMDGFALRLADLPADPAGTLPVAADLPAAPGDVAPLPPGAAARIMTGAPLPPGADAVIEVERTDADPHGPAPAVVAVPDREGLVAGRHVRGAGEEVARGQVLARAGDRVGPGLLALATTLGIGALDVERPTRAVVVVTGDELVAPDDAAGATQVGAVRESNGTMLAAALAELGVSSDVVRCGDDPTTLAAVVDAAAARADLVLTSGGIGHGAFDVVKAALGPSGRGTSTFVHVRLRPGGPQGAGHVAVEGRDVPVIHLPGTPVGALVGFHLFVRPLLGRPGMSTPILATIRADAQPDAGALARRPGREGGASRTLVRPGLLARAEDGSLAVDLVPGSRLAPYGRADCLVILDGAAAHPGQQVRVLAL